MLSFERTDEVVDIDEQFPKRFVAGDAKALALSTDIPATTQEFVDAPSHTENAISTSSIYTLANPSLNYYYDDIIGVDNLQDSLVQESPNSLFSENRALSQTILRNELGMSSLETYQPRKLKKGQTLFAPELSQVTALYYRLADQLSDRLSINELNIIVNNHGYISTFGRGNAYLRNLNHNVLNLNDYFAPLFDTLYRTCVNDNVLVQIRSSYEGVYQPPTEVTIQSSASASNHLSISSLRQARSFIHGVTWLMFSTAMNNILASVRGMSFSNWSAKVISELTPKTLSIFDEPDPRQQKAIDDFERLKVDVISWVESLLISRRATLASHPRYSKLHSPEGCITLFEAHRWVDYKAGEIYLESRHIVTTATILLFSGLLDQLSSVIHENGETEKFDVANEWLTPSYLISAIENTKDVGAIIEENEGVRRAFERAVLDNHRHYYPPSALI